MAQKTMYPAQISSPGTELAAAASASANEITLLDASKLPDAPNLATIGSDETAEVVLYTGKTSNKLTGVTRGFQGAAKSWSVGARVARYFTAADHDTFISNIKDLDERVNNIKVPDASLTKKGITSLSSATDSSSEEEAATPLAVKTAMDRANAAFTSASEGKGRVATAITGAKGTVQVADPTAGPTFDELATGAGTILAGATADATATAAQIRAGQTAYKGGQKVTGTLPVRATAAQTITTNQTLAAGIYDGAIAINTPTPPTVAVGSTRIASSGDLGPIPERNYTRKYSYKVNFKGTYRVGFAISGQGLDGAQKATTVGRVYVNGIARGIERSANTSTGATFVEDFAANANDTIEIWIYGYDPATAGSTNPNYVRCNNFTLDITPFVYATGTAG